MKNVYDDDDDEFICVTLHKTHKISLFLGNVLKKKIKMLLLKNNIKYYTLKKIQESALVILLEIICFNSLLKRFI